MSKNNNETNILTEGIYLWVFYVSVSSTSSADGNVGLVMVFPISYADENVGSSGQI